MLMAPDAMGLRVHPVCFAGYGAAWEPIGEMGLVAAEIGEILLRPRSLGQVPPLDGTVDLADVLVTGRCGQFDPDVGEAPEEDSGDHREHEDDDDELSDCEPALSQG